MSENPAQPAANRLKTGLILAGLAALAAVLFVFPPDQFGFYPRCLLYSTTGLQCPGCGGLRAAHHLLHGQLAAAFRLNPLLVAMLPVLAWLFVGSLAKQASGRDWLRPLRRPVWLWLLLAVVVAFSIARNLVSVLPSP